MKTPTTVHHFSLPKNGSTDGPAKKCGNTPTTAHRHLRVVPDHLANLANAARLLRIQPLPSPPSQQTTPRTSTPLYQTAPKTATPMLQQAPQTVRPIHNTPRAATPLLQQAPKTASPIQNSSHAATQILQQAPKTASPITTTPHTVIQNQNSATPVAQQAPPPATPTPKNKKHSATSRALHRTLPAVGTIPALTNAQLETPPRGEVILGRGAYGEVKLKYINQTPAAVKYVGFEDREAVLLEARAMAALSTHDSFPTLYGTLVSGKEHALVMQFLGDPGTGECLTLAGAVTGPRCLTLLSADWVTLAINIVDGLKFMHDKNLLHNDIKGDNILVNHEGGFWRAYIIDVGLCSLVGHPRRHVLDVAGKAKFRQFHGHIAPELVEFGLPESTFSDIFQVGKVFSRMSKYLGMAELKKVADWCEQEDPKLRPSTAVLHFYMHINRTKLTR